MGQGSSKEDMSEKMEPSVARRRDNETETGLSTTETCKEYGQDADVKNWQEMKEDVETLFSEVCSAHSAPGKALEICSSFVLNPVRKFITDLVDNARPPVMYVLGRSGHGKSSLINALTSGTSAKVGHTSPTTPYAKSYQIRFEGSNCVWTIIDSRGIFETTKADGANDASATDEVKNDLQRYKPDIILYVVCGTEARNLHNDLKFLDDTFGSLKSTIGVIPPVIVVLSKADIVGHSRQWPPEDYKAKQLVLEELMKYMSIGVLSAVAVEPLEENTGYYGYELKECVPFLYIIPTATIQEEPQLRWNIDRLSLLIGSKMPCQAWLHYYKAHKNKNVMKGLISQVINQFTVIAAVIGAIPGPGISIGLLMPLLIAMIGLIARLAGHDYARQSLWQFIRGIATGVSCVAAGATSLVSFLAMAEMLETVLVGIGCVVGATAAGGATYCVGKAAEAYFFEGIIKTPEYFKKEWKPPL